MSNPTQLHTVDMDFDKETKNKVVYAAPNDFVSTIYIDKACFPTGQYPTRITVDITTLED